MLKGRRGGGRGLQTKERMAFIEQKRLTS